jgi:hypothetical protein
VKNILHFRLDTAKEMSSKVDYIPIKTIINEQRKNKCGKPK